MNTKKLLALGVGPLLGGFIFAFGLTLSGMTEPAKVIGFLDIFGHWDPTLMFVLGGAVVTHAIAYRIIKRRESPLFDTKFHMPTRKDIDPKLVWGGIIFGAGWGVAGLCPGPALTSLVTLSTPSILFVGSLLVSTFAVKWWQERAA